MNTGKVSTLDTEQMYAIKRIYEIASNHVKEKFEDKDKCHLITEIFDLCEKYYEQKERK
jgi:hypothetical protein